MTPARSLAGTLPDHLQCAFTPQNLEHKDEHSNREHSFVGPTSQPRGLILSDKPYLIEEQRLEFEAWFHCPLTLWPWEAYWSLKLSFSHCNDEQRFCSPGWPWGLAEMHIDNVSRRMCLILFSENWVGFRWGLLEWSISLGMVLLVSYELCHSPRRSNYSNLSCSFSILQVQA